MNEESAADRPWRLRFGNERWKPRASMQAMTRWAAMTLR